MSGQSTSRDILARRARLLAIGQRLRAEYADAVAQHVPERLAGLLKQLEGPAPVSVQPILSRYDGHDHPVAR